jgi:hypothetical protein
MSNNLPVERQLARLFAIKPANSLALALAGTLSLGLTHSAHAFFEDICYFPNKSEMTNCAPLPASCSLKEPVSNLCRTEAAATFAVLQLATLSNPSIPGRSTVHADATYMMAQAIGFPERNAYWIAAYNEASDLGSFAPRDAYGKPVSTEKSTATIDGVTRNAMDTGGFLLHFHAPRNHGTSVPGQVDGLHPDVDDPDTEVVVDHLRRWAMYTSLAPACTSGLTVRSASGNYTTGNTCYKTDNNHPGHVVGSIGLIGSIVMPFNPPPATGFQVIATNDATGGETITSDQFDQYINKTDGVSHVLHAADARLGLYLHVLADRVSHHVCSDASVLTDPNSSGNFTEHLSNPDCVQPLHGLRHMYETGVNFAELSPQDQTTTAALQVVYDELVVFAEARGVLNSKAKDAKFRGQLLNNIATALQQPIAVDRVAALSKVACQAGLKPFPGAPACRP